LAFGADRRGAGPGASSALSNDAVAVFGAYIGMGGAEAGMPSSDSTISAPP
jgi:hypothetical protein